MFGVLIPVGPDPRDVERLHDLTAELDRHENPAEMALFIVDDAPVARELVRCRTRVKIIRTPLWSRGRPDTLSAHVAGTLIALRAAADLEFVVKLDTDAAVIRPFSAALRARFADPTLGVVGSCDRAFGGGLRDWSLWRGPIEAADRPIALSRHAGWPEVWWRSATSRRTVRQVRAAAYAKAPPGAHCLGGAYAVSAAFLRAAALDWRPWIRTRLGEDVVVGLLCSAAGLDMRSLTAPGEPFALAWRGLPASPAEIAAHGASIVHSVKCEDAAEEAALRRQLQAAAAEIAPLAGR